jgi:hypothetical protein
VQVTAIRRIGDLPDAVRAQMDEMVRGTPDVAAVLLVSVDFEGYPISVASQAFPDKLHPEFGVAVEELVEAVNKRSQR